MGRIDAQVMRRSAEDFRRPMTVRRMRLFANGDCYPVCPRCGLTLERDYQAFCDRCGQHLGWKGEVS